MEKAASTGYPPVTENEYALIAPFLEDWKLEKYDTVDEEIYYDSEDDYRLENTHEVVKKFLKQVRTSRGYDVDCIPPPCVGSPFMPAILSKEWNEEFYNDVMDAAGLAVRQINVETKTTIGKTYELLHVEKVVETTNLKMLLTFTAREFVAGAEAGADAPVKTFQAMVYYPYYRDPIVNEWRFKPVSPAATSAS